MLKREEGARHCAGRSSLRCTPHTPFYIVIKELSKSTTQTVAPSVKTSTGFLLQLA